MRPSESLAKHRTALRELAIRHGLRNIRLFGSAATNQDREGSDIDLLVDAPPGTTFLTLARLRREARELTGVPVDIATAASLHEDIRERVLQDALAL